jgi:MYXO-CTERM domain-containing protein
MKKLSMRALKGFFGRIALPFGSIALVLTVHFVAPSPSFACKCAPPPAPAEALAQSSAVFEAQVTQVNATADELEVTMHVTRAWKGVDTETIRVRTRKDSAACGVEFALNQIWLVYANQTTEPGSAIGLQVLRCGRSRLAEEAADDFAALGLGVVPVAPRDPTPAAPDAGAPKPGQPNQPKPVTPAANGCASCSVGRAEASPRGFAALALAAMWFAWRRSKRHIHKATDQ